MVTISEIYSIIFAFGSVSVLSIFLVYSYFTHTYLIDISHH